MFSELIPNISRHFLFSVLERDQKSGMEIIESIATLQPEQISEFLYSLGNSLTGYFFRLEAGLEGYDEIRIQELQDMKNLHLEEDSEGFN